MAAHPGAGSAPPESLSSRPGTPPPCLIKPRDEQAWGIGDPGGYAGARAMLDHFSPHQVDPAMALAVELGRGNRPEAAQLATIL